MVGMICGCCNPPGITFCFGKQSTTGTLNDNFAPTPFANFPLPPGDIGPGTFNAQTYEGWRAWRRDGDQKMPWKRIPTDQRFHGLAVIPPSTSFFALPWEKFYRTSNLSVRDDAFLYSLDFLQAKYYTQIDVNLDLQYAPPFNGPFGFGGFVEDAYVGPSHSFAGIFYQEQEFQAAAPMGPILTVFMRRESFRYTVNSIRGEGPWGQYWYITDRTSPTSTAALKQINLLNDSQPVKRLGCLVECINLEDYNTANRPVLRYTLDVNGVVIYTNTYRFKDSQHNNGWRTGGYCRCVMAGYIGTGGSSGLFGPGYSQFAIWPYDPEPYYWADNFRIEEIPL